MYHSGGGRGESLLSVPESELRLGREEEKGKVRKRIDGMSKNKNQTSRIAVLAAGFWFSILFPPLVPSIGSIFGSPIYS